MLSYQNLYYNSPEIYTWKHHFAIWKMGKTSICEIVEVINLFGTMDPLKMSFNLEC